MGKLLDLTDPPALRDPFLVVHLHGWTDAGLAGQTAAVFLRSRWNATPLATFDADELIDFRARRPVVRLASGHIEEVTWSPTELLQATPGGDRDALLLTGPEPDFRWGAFCDEVIEACRRLEVVEVFGLGAFPAPALHTDPVAVVGTSADSDLAERLETVPVIVELSAGIQTVLEERLHRAGIPATGLWARVPPTWPAAPTRRRRWPCSRPWAGWPGSRSRPPSWRRPPRTTWSRSSRPSASAPRSPSSSTRSAAWSSRAPTSASPPATRSPPSSSASSARSTRH